MMKKTMQMKMNLKRYKGRYSTVGRWRVLSRRIKEVHSFFRLYVCHMHMSKLNRESR